MKKIYIPFLLLGLLILSSCEGWFLDCIEGNGRIRTETRNTIPFDELTMGGSFDVIIIRSDEYGIEVEAEENLIPYISTRVRNGHLEIEAADHRCIRNNLPISIYVYTPELHQIVLSGSGSIVADTMQTSSLDIILSGSGSIQLDAINHSTEILLSGSGEIDLGLETEVLDARISGSGDIHLQGSAGSSEMFISGSGQYLAYGLEQDRCLITISASGRAYVWVNQLLDVYISGSGSVYYRGQPEVRATISGSGTVINDN